MKRIIVMLVVGLSFSPLTQFTTPVQAAWWESVQPEARIWLKKVDPAYDKRLSDDDRPWIDAEVHGIDVENRALIIHHGPIPAATMPAMTMSFPVRESVDLRKLNPGENIQVRVADIGGVISVISYRMRR